MTSENYFFLVVVIAAEYLEPPTSNTNATAPTHEEIPMSTTEPGPFFLSFTATTVKEYTLAIQKLLMPKLSQAISIIVFAVVPCATFHEHTVFSKLDFQKLACQ